MKPNALLLNIDQAYAQFPRPRWAGKVMVLLRGHAFDGLGNGSHLQGSTDKQELSVAVAEIPVMRLPDGFDAVAILDLAASECFAEGEQEIEAQLHLAG